jgi:uncharacterized protein (DUF3820 family)
MSNQQPITEEVNTITVEVSPPTYTERLIEAFKSTEKTTFSLKAVQAIISRFSKKEYEERKKNTDTMPFGKYKFKRVEDVAKFDSQYFKWLLKQSMMDNYEGLKTEILKHLD